MTERWVIGIDGSFGSRSALEWALEESGRRDVDLVVAHAYGTPVSQRIKELVGGRDERESGAASTALAELDASIADLVDDRRVERHVVGGHAGSALLTVAADADALIVGRHGSGGGWHDVIGSVSRFCVSHAQVPTIVVPTDRRPARTDQVLVGFDGSEHSAAAVRWAMQFASASTVVRVLIALEIAPWLRSDLVAMRFGDELEAEEARLRDALDLVDPHGLVERVVEVRGARPALARAADDADLVVLGRRGAGRLTSLVVGSVSTWMLDASPVPVAVIPAHPSREEQPC